MGPSRFIRVANSSARGFTRPMLARKRMPRPTDVPREAAARKGMFRRSSFWDVLMDVATQGTAAYTTYSYREKCDCYRRELDRAAAERLRAAADAVKFNTLREQIRSSAFSRM